MAFSTELCKTGAEMELNVYDGTVRDIIFTEDSVNRSTVFMSGGAGNCRIHSTYCSNGHTFASYKGHTDACIVKVLCSYSWPLHMGQWVVRELFSKQDSAFLGLALATGNQRRYSQQQNRHASTMQTPKEWNIESLLGELVESSDRDNMADSDTVEYAITRATKSACRHDESALAYSKEVASAEGESAFGGTVDGNHDCPHFKQEKYRLGARSKPSEGKQDPNLGLHQSRLNEHGRLIEESTRLLVANFSSSQLDRCECYRRSSFPRRKIQNVYETLCPQLIHRFTRQTASDNVVIAVAGLAKLFVGDLAEEALETQNRMNEGSEPLKPNHIDFAYEALRGKGLLFPIKPRRSPFLYMLHTVLACPQVLNPGITRHVGRKDFWMRVFLHL